jgi:predicted  nucleic acid-binding Zn-ribbon protein
MADSYLQLRNIEFTGPTKKAQLSFQSGVNVICGASDTGKSFLAEAVDFMLGGSSLKEIPERVDYGKIGLSIGTTEGEEWRIERATSGGDFSALDLNAADSQPIKLKQNHAHDRVDNLSGFLLDKIGLLGKRILKSSTKGTTVSLSFRNLARLIIVQEGEIQQSGSPFWGGQYTLKTAELATVKLLLTGVDDSSVVSASAEPEVDNAGQIAFIDELIADLGHEISDAGHDENELSSQLEKLEGSIGVGRERLEMVQRKLDERVFARRQVFEEREAIEGRLSEIGELLARFALLKEHYQVDLERLTAIRESGSMFAYVEAVACPLCGAAPNDQHVDETCDGDVESIVQAAAAEMGKIERLVVELDGTVGELEAEREELSGRHSTKAQEFEQLELEIHETVSPEVSEVRSEFSELVEERASAQKALEVFGTVQKLEARKQSLIESEEEPRGTAKVATGLPESVSHALSLKIEGILKAWNFPGQCRVHFDKETSDFVIDGKPRASRGKGLRAITHAAVTIGVLEYCQENSLSHPGFVILDSPLLAYFKPEGDDDLELQGTDLKERFYQYLIQHHGSDSQVVIIENQHPPSSVENDLKISVFTRNPSEGRFGLL